MRDDRRVGGGIVFEGATDSVVDMAVTVSGYWQQGEQRVDLTGPTYVEPSGKYVTVEDVLAAARAQGTLLTKAERLSRERGILADDTEFVAALAELDDAALTVGALQNAHVDLYYPSSYAVPNDGRLPHVEEIYDLDGKLVVSSLGGFRHGYRYFLAVGNCQEVSLQAHRTDATKPYYEINGPKQESPDDTRLA